jgi:hypothetical protein
MANEFKVRKGLLVEASGSTSGSTLVDVQGTVGQVFSITDNLIGSIFSVNDISGIPLLDVNSNGTVIGGISTTTPTASIQEGVSSTYGDMADWDAYYASGEILKNQELGENLSYGQCVALNGGSSHVWALADQTKVDSCSYMLGVALESGGTGDLIDILIKGFVEVTDWITNNGDRNGFPIYLRENAKGRFSGDIPTTGVVRLVGYTYQNTTTNSNSKVILRFDPDNTWVEL